jgi:regulator of protease activity HflC (stomatin/prohibitin superfamily)
MSHLWDLLDLVEWVLKSVLAHVVDYAKNHRVVTALAVLALLRLFGITVQSGSKGVLFVFGRVREELGPGFHFLVPFVTAARTIPVRSVTLDLPRQRITTADGLVYDVQANIVYRVADPKLALTQIDNLRHGIEAKLPLIVEDLLRSQTRAGILDFTSLEAELGARAEAALQRWGVTVEQAGFKSIAPTHKTLRLTQLLLLGAERERVVLELLAHGVTVNAALALMGADRRLVGHATARYHALHRPAQLAPAAAEALHSPPPFPGEGPPAADKPLAAAAPPEPEGEAAGFIFGTNKSPAPAPPRPKKTTTGLQPRSWLRLQRRLRGNGHIRGCRA